MIMNDFISSGFITFQLLTMVVTFQKKKRKTHKLCLDQGDFLLVQIDWNEIANLESLSKILKLLGLVDLNKRRDFKFEGSAICNRRTRKMCVVQSCV